MKRAVEGNAWQADHILPVYKVGTILPCLGLLPAAAHGAYVGSVPAVL